MLTTSEITRAKASVGALRPASILAGLIAGVLTGLFVVTPPDWHVARPPAPVSVTTPKLDALSPEDLQQLVVTALTKLGEHRELTNAGRRNTSQDPSELIVYGAKDIERGVTNMQRLLPSVKRWTIDAIRKAAAADDVKPSEWPRVTRLVDGVRRIVRSHSLRCMALVRDDRLSEILVDSDYAPFLASDDEAVFVLAHELTHVAARSNVLDQFIKEVAQKVKQLALLEPAEGQWEDLACDFVAELVLKQFIAVNPTDVPAASRVSSVLGYESPAERFARAWEDFCASYNGDPGDAEHLNQYQTIRALIALDPELQPLMPFSGNLTCPSLTQAASCESQSPEAKSKRR